jgi:Ribonuclease G/E
VVFEILRRVEREATAQPGRPLVVRAAPEVVRWLDTHADEVRAGLARRGAARVQFEARNEYTREGFDVGALA